MLDESLIPILIVSGPAAFVIALYTGFRVFFILKRIREESRKSFEIGQRIEREYEEKRRHEEEERRRLMSRFDELESDLTQRVDEAQKVATGTRDRLIKLEKYLKDFFEVELKSVFDSFDKTVASILGEMKAELLRGVDRIEEIQAVVESKSFAQERILEGEGSVYRMISDTNTPQPSDGAESAGEADQGEPEETGASDEEPLSTDDLEEEQY